MSYFVESLKDLLLEKGMTLKDLSHELPIPERTLYDCKKFNPTIKNALIIVDYFFSSLDYFERRHNYQVCVFDRNYKIKFYENLIVELQKQKLSQAKLCRETHISESCFKRWKRGVLPTYENLVLISNYLECSIDNLLGRKYEIKNK